MMRSFFSGAQAHRRLVVCAFFAALFVVGLIAFPDYGVSWDEPNMFRVSENVYQYVFGGQPWPTIVGERFYGTVFELPAGIAMHALSLSDGRSILLLRHFLTFCAFFVGVFFFYLLAKRWFASRWMGLTAALFLVLSPRIFADAFYNSKDIPNLAVFIIAMYTLTRFLEEKNPRWMALHAVGTALAIGIRLTSLIIPPLTGLFLLLHILRDWKRGSANVGKRSLLFAGYCVLTVLCTVAVWPFLWEQPIAHLQEAFSFMSTLGVSTYYMGEMIHRLPWHYVFVWIGITSPPLYIALFLLGVFSIAAAALRHPVQWLLHRSDQLIPLLWLLLPILSVHLSGAGIFDGWRHLYFVYPAVIIVALWGIVLLLRLLSGVPLLYGEQRARIVLATVVLAHSLWIAGWMIAYHPVQNAYFSIPARYVQHNFELDYWGLSFRPAFEYLLRYDPSPVLRIWASSSPAYSTVGILPPEQQQRIQFVDEADATYLLNNYRLFGYDQNYPHPEISAIYAGGVKVLGIYTQ